ncbi:MAG: sugar phosphate isomerase/epimerase [Clostridia bacterium]|nr:sugar phosphate isomerase/epimerase [Clostridia bacterium]
MRIGISASSLEKQGYGRFGEDTYLKLKEHGFSCTDFNMADTNAAVYTKDLAQAEAFLQRERAMAEAAGIEINQVHGPWRWPPKDATEEDRKERMEKMKKSIYLTAVLGCKNWVVHPIMPLGLEDADTENALRTWAMNFVFMEELLETAKEYDVTVCLENMPMHKFSMSKPKEILNFVEQIGDDHFKICLDTGHVSVFPELDLAEETRRLGKEIRVLHVHDNRYNCDMHLNPYDGIVDWESFGKALRDIQFDGVFSLETAPGGKLPDALFEEKAKHLVHICKHIIGTV